MRRSFAAIDPALMAMKEAAFQRQVEDHAKRMGWLTYHTWNSEKSVPGFPDLVAMKPPRLIIAELKTMKGQPSPEQCEFLEMLQHCPSVECWLWRPNDWQLIEEILQ